jgi:molecular chaperone DnaJ
MSSTPCGTCGGDGRVRKSRTINVTIPAGVEDGTRLRISGEGSVGRKGGPPGDLYVYMSVKEHPELRREGQTVYSDVSVRCALFLLRASTHAPDTQPQS